jgi:hypothetical protein
MYHRGNFGSAMTDKPDSGDSSDRPPQRFATRIPGDGWEALVAGIAAPVRVIRLSRIGIELETEASLEAGTRYPIRLTHAGKTTSTTFYVLRSPEHANGARKYRTAGLFVETLDRDDLPAMIPPSSP